MISQSLLLPLALSCHSFQEIPIIAQQKHGYEIVEHHDLFRIPEMQQKPRFWLQDLQQNIADILGQSWACALEEKRISFDPERDPEKKPLLSTKLVDPSLAPFIFFYALKRNSKPAPTHYSNTSIQETRHEQFSYLTMHERLPCFDLIKIKLEALHIIKPITIDDVLYYRWCIGKLPAQETLAAFLDPSEIIILKEAWKACAPDQNPFQSLDDYKQSICFFDSLDRNLTYAIICNRFPLVSHHFVIYSTEKDKPQYIASASEIMDMLSIQKQLHHQKYSVGFNSNNTAHSQGASSVNVWHWQIGQLGISADEYTFEPKQLLSPITTIGKLESLQSTHIALKSSSCEEISRIAYIFINILHEHNNSYNINLGYDAESNQYIVVITPRGNWDIAKISSENIPDFDHKPGFVEILGGFCATTPELYEYMQQLFQNSSAQQLQQKIIILQKKWLARACIDETLFNMITDEFNQKNKY
jgi:hypothetical protein